MAGLEADLAVMWRRAHHAFIVSLGSIIAPFLLGYVVAIAVPGTLGIPAGVHPRVFALLFATAMFISAVPVIARTLMDLNLYRTDLGMITMAVAVFKDVVGWFLFASILGSTGIAQSRPIWMTLLFAIAFGVLTLTVGRMALRGMLRWMTRHNASPVAALSFLLAIAFISGACAEWVGIHALFGAFLVGTVLGTSDSLPQETRKMLGEFVIAFFAPLFFASIGLRVDFIHNFDLSLVLIVLAIGCAGTVGGTTLCARFAGMEKRNALALGFALNSRGAMEIVLGTLALQYGLIGERLFVALVVMALATSMASGPAISKLLRIHHT
jgi:Kef-type K+ transport system membrane component KefB